MILNTKNLTLFAISFLLSVVFIPISPDNGYAGMVFVTPGCCQNISESGPGFECSAGDSFSCPAIPGFDFVGFFPNETCNQDTGLCPGFIVSSSVPTLSEWGLIAFAGILGVTGFIAIRRKRLTL